MSEREQTKKQKIVRTSIYVFAAILVALVIAIVIIGQLPVTAP